MDRSELLEDKRLVELIKKFEGDVSKILGRNVKLSMFEVNHKILMEEDTLIDDIKMIVARYYRINISDLDIASRRRPLPEARFMCYRLIRELSPISLNRIGQLFGHRDHSTVIHGLGAIDDLMLTDRSVREAYDRLCMDIKRINPDLANEK